MTTPPAISQAAKELEDRRRDYEELFRMPSGAFARILKRILSAAGTYVHVLPERSESGNQIYVNGAQQKLGMDLVKEILALVPAQWLEFYKREIKDLMMKEKS